MDSNDSLINSGVSLFSIIFPIFSPSNIKLLINCGDVNDLSLSKNCTVS